jgi:interleukin-1 receptor-associated kinase 1
LTRPLLPVAGTFGYMAPEYVITCTATRQTDTYAFGVLILEIITGNKNADVPADDSHITLWVRRLHREGKLLEAIDNMFSSDHQSYSVDEAKRLLLLGLACTLIRLVGRAWRRWCRSSAR